MLLSSGQACGYPMKATHAKYGAFAYSSAFGFSVPPGLFSLEQYALASQLGLSDDGGEYWKTRRISEYAGIEYRDDKPVLVSRWKPFSDVEITSILVPSTENAPNWHLRIHRIQTGRQLLTADGSFAICNVNSVNSRYLELYDQDRCEGTMPKIIGNYDTNTPAGWAAGKDGSFAVHATKGAVGIKALETTAGRRAMLVNADPNSNLIDSRTTIPTLQHTMEKGQTAWYVSAIFARPGQSGMSQRTYLDGWQTPPEIPRWLSAEMNESSL